MSYARIVVVTKKTPYEELLVTHNTHGQAAFVLQSLGGDIDEYRALHQRYYDAVRVVEAVLPKTISHTLVERQSLPSMLFRPDDLVIAIGPDGLFANLAKYLSGQPVVGVNPLPEVIDGVVMRFQPVALDISNILTLLLNGGGALEEITLAEAKTSTGARLLAVNDFLIGRLDHISARYVIESNGVKERQSSSGVLVATGLGSSGWMRSVKQAASAAHDEYPVLLPNDPAWDEQRLIFAVREPFPSRATQADIVYGEITKDSPLQIVSEMPEGGVVFSDGVPEDSLPLPAGTVLSIGVASEKVRLVVP